MYCTCTHISVYRTIVFSAVIMHRFAIINFKFLQLCSEAKRRALAYSRALCDVTRYLISWPNTTSLRRWFFTAHVLLTRCSLLFSRRRRSRTHLTVVIHHDLSWVKRGANVLLQYLFGAITFSWRVHTAQDVYLFSPLIFLPRCVFARSLTFVCVSLLMFHYESVECA